MTLVGTGRLIVLPGGTLPTGGVGPSELAAERGDRIAADATKADAADLVALRTDLEAGLAPVSALSDVVGRIDIIGPAAVASGASALPTDRIYPFESLVTAAGDLRSVTVSIYAPGSFRIYELTPPVVAGGVFVVRNSKTISATSAGVQKFAVGFAVAAGSVIGVRGRDIVGRTAGPGTGFWVIDPATMAAANASIDTSVQIQIRYELVPTDPDSLIGQVAAIQAAGVEPRVTSIEDQLGTSSAEVIGPAAVVTGGTAVGSNNIYAFDVAVQADGPLSVCQIATAAAGSITVYELRQASSIQFEILQSKAVTIPSAGVHDVDTGWTVRAGSLLAVRGNGVLSYLAGAGIPWYAIDPGNLRDSSGTDPNAKIQMRFVVSHPPADSIVGRIAAIEDQLGNVGAEPLPVWRLMRARALIGTGPVRILCVGDSNTMGWSNFGVGVNRRARSYPTYLSREINAGPIPGRADAIFGRAIINNNSSEYTTYDPRVTFGSGWGLGGAASLGGEMFVCSTAGAVLTFTPTAAWDRAEVWVAPTAATTIELEAGGTVQSYTPTVGQITRLTLNLSATTTGPLLIRNVSGTTNMIGASVWTSSAPGACVLNAGRASWTAGNYADASAFYSPRNAIAFTDPDLILIELGLNDANTSVPVATYEANMRALIDAGIAAGADVAIVIPFPPNLSNWSSYTAVMHALAAEYGLEVFDTTARLGSYSAALAAGFVANDLHLTAEGLSDKAKMIAARL